MPKPSINFKENILKKIINGGITFLFQKSQSLSSSIGVFVRIGSGLETKEEAGYSHFLEHMLFKDTKNFTSYQIVNEIEKYGGYINALTTKEYTSYYISIDSNYIEKALEILNEMIFQPKLSGKDIKLESKVILEELLGYEDSPEEYIHDLFFKNLFQKHSLGRDILGTKQSIKNVNEKKLRNFYRSNYSKNNLILAISGNFNNDFISRLAVEKFGNSNSMQSRTKERRFNENIKKSFQLFTEFQNLEQIHFILSGTAKTKNFQNTIQFNILSHILGGGMSSILFQKVREKEGYCYQINSFFSLFPTTGLIGITCSTSTKNFFKCIDSVFDSLKKILIDGFTQDDFMNAKSNYIGSLSIGYESPESKMNNIALQELFYNNYFTFQDRINFVNQFKIDDLNVLFYDCFSLPKLHLTILGNNKKLDKTRLKKINLSLKNEN